MNTRTELWKDYRSEIEKNIELKKAVQHSNEKLRILYGRLINVFPEYEEKYKSSADTLNISLEKIETTPEYSINAFEDILYKINDIEDSTPSSLSSIDNLNFSSKELDEVIKEIKKGKIKSRDYISGENTSDVNISLIREVDLGGYMSKINIAIDGPSGSGKSAAAKLIAKKYGLTYVNTGLVYRAAALHMLNNSIDLMNPTKVIEELPNVSIELLEDEIVMLLGRNVTKEVRSDEVSQNASIIASITEVRKWALKIMQDKALCKGIVMDGRDITFRVMPNAELKIFLDTNPEVRAKRRIEQNKRLGFSTDYDEILNEIKIRDHRDRTRDTDPLHKTKDAILIDSSNMTLEEVVKKLSFLIEHKVKRR